jgi:hypothetical protein
MSGSWKRLQDSLTVVIGVLLFVAPFAFWSDREAGGGLDRLRRRRAARDCRVVEFNQVQPGKPCCRVG